MKFAVLAVLLLTTACPSGDEVILNPHTPESESSDVSEPIANFEVMMVLSKNHKFGLFLSHRKRPNVRPAIFETEPSLIETTRGTFIVVNSQGKYVEVGALKQASMGVEVSLCQDDYASVCSAFVTTSKNMNAVGYHPITSFYLLFREDQSLVTFRPLNED